MKAELSCGEELWVAGPASITVSRGRIRLLGAEYGRGSRIIVPRYRSYTLRTLEESLLEAVVGEEGELRAAEAPGVSEEWEKTVEEALRMGGAMMLGPVDSGKTTLAALAANMALGMDMKPAIIDGDVGQADIGPPAFVSMAHPHSPILWIRELRAEAMVFVGHTSPAPAPGLVASGIALLARRSGRPVIIDTDGWVESARALEYKYMLMQAVEPPAAILVGDRLKGFFEKAARLLGMRLLVVPPPPSLRPRSRADRRMLRRDAYRRYLEDAGVLELRLDRIAVLGSCLYSGTPLSEAEVRAIEDLTGLRILAATRSDTLVLVVEKAPGPEEIEALREAVGQAVLVEKGGEKGLLAGIIAGPAEQAPGLVEEVDFEQNTMLVRTSWEGDVRGIHIGRIRLNQDYVEERVTRCPI